MFQYVRITIISLFENHTVFFKIKTFNNEILLSELDGEIQTEAPILHSVTPQPTAAMKEVMVKILI